MTILLRVAERVLIVLIPACVLYFTNFGDAATRLDTMLDDTVSPMAAAVSPFAFAIGLFLGILSFCHVAARRVFEWLPLSIKMSFGFYRDRWAREELYPSVTLAVELNRQWKMQSLEPVGSNSKFDDFSAQVGLVRAKLSQVGIRLAYTNFAEWETFLRTLAPLARDGQYGYVRNLCLQYRDRL